MGLRKRIWRAVENAPVADDFVETTNDNFSLYTHEADDYPVQLGEVVFHELPNEVALDMERDLALRQLLEAYEDITDATISPEYIEYAQRHERQHFEAAKRLGAVSARVGVRFFNVQSPGYASEITVQPFLRIVDFKTTKLGAALVSAYPAPPSAGDEIDIKTYGYLGIDELADRAMRRNRAIKNSASEQYYPIPLGAGSTFK
jgi:hypothetical protein